MYYVPNMYPYPYYVNMPIYNYGRQSGYWNPPVAVDYANGFGSFHSSNSAAGIMEKDYGPEPFVFNINQATKQNNTFRTVLWTGDYFQITLMSLGVGEDIGLEMHPDVDQFLRVEQGQGIVQMGESKNNFSFQKNIYDDSAIIVPAGTWHNIINTGDIPLKLYSIYAPPNHPFGTVHETKADALAAEEDYGHGE